MAMLTNPKDKPTGGRGYYSGGGGRYYYTELTFWEKTKNVFITILNFIIKVFFYIFVIIAYPFIILYKLILQVPNLLKGTFNVLVTVLEKAQHLYLKKTRKFYYIYVIIPIKKENTNKGYLFKKSMFFFGELIKENGVVVLSNGGSDFEFRQDFESCDISEDINSYLRQNNPFGVLILDKSLKKEKNNGAKLFLDLNQILVNPDILIKGLSILINDINRKENLFSKYRSPKNLLDISEHFINTHYHDDSKFKPQVVLKSYIDIFSNRIRTKNKLLTSNSQDKIKKVSLYELANDNVDILNEKNWDILNKKHKLELNDFQIEKRLNELIIERDIAVQREFVLNKLIETKVNRLKIAVLLVIILYMVAVTITAKILIGWDRFEPITFCIISPIGLLFTVIYLFIKGKPFNIARLISEEREKYKIRIYTDFSFSEEIVGILNQKIQELKENIISKDGPNFFFYSNSTF